ncbi:MAG: M48 family metallopeptidase [Chloroflexi bacterium]|nr:M48 family metallopeptidase [Chloroflexota bacterium]
MSTSNHKPPSAILTVNGIEVQVVRKAIKNVHLAVYPPDGRVRVAVPLHVTDDNVRLAVINKLGWIKKQQAAFEAQPRQSQREMVTGESHYVWGRRYLLDVVERAGKHEVVIKNNARLILYVNPDTTRANRELALNEWYRAKIKKRVPALLAKWEPIIGEQVAEWGVKRMKTKWGSCHIARRRILLNLELAKKPVECLEYILVHEMVHLLERRHNDAFRAHMDRFLPQWPLHRDILNQAPLAHEDWEY